MINTTVTYLVEDRDGEIVDYNIETLDEAIELAEEMTKYDHYAPYTVRFVSRVPILRFYSKGPSYKPVAGLSGAA